MEKVHVGKGFAIIERDDGIQISWEVGMFGEKVFYDISREDMEKALRSDEDAYEVMVSAETGRLPLSPEEEIERDKDFIRKYPKLLLRVPANQILFDEKELKELMSKAEEDKEK